MIAKAARNVLFRRSKVGPLTRRCFKTIKVLTQIPARCTTQRWLRAAGCIPSTSRIESERIGRRILQTCQALRQLLKHFTASLEILKLIEAGTGRGQQ